MIQDILIHEAFSKIHVGFYMAVVVKGRDEVVVVFPVRAGKPIIHIVMIFPFEKKNIRLILFYQELLPRRHILEKVWRGARACLYESNA